MEYTYKVKNYPKDLNIKHQEVFTTLSKDPLDITRREFDHLFDIPTEEFCADEEQLGAKVQSSWSQIRLSTISS